MTHDSSFMVKSCRQVLGAASFTPLPCVAVERDLLLDFFLQPLNDRLLVGVFENPRDDALRAFFAPACAVLEVVAGC